MMKKSVSTILLVTLLLFHSTTFAQVENDQIGEVAALQLEAQIQALNSKGRGQQVGGAITLILGGLFLIAGLAGSNEDNPYTYEDEGDAALGAGVILGALFGVTGGVLIAMGSGNKNKARDLERSLEELRHGSRIEHPRVRVAVVRW